MMTEIDNKRQCYVGDKIMSYIDYDFREDQYRFGLKLTDDNPEGKTLLVVGFNPGGKTNPQKGYIGSTVRRVRKLPSSSRNSERLIAKRA